MFVSAISRTTAGAFRAPNQRVLKTLVVGITRPFEYVSKIFQFRTLHSSLSVQRQPSLTKSAPVELSRVMVPDDTNPHGNVHGGTILKLVEQAGNIVATRHCNKEKEGKNPVITVLARVDHVDFLQPMYVGEISQLQAAVTYTSPRSMEVTVDVWAENVRTGTRRHTNTATLWYVAVPTGGECKASTKLNPVSVPLLKGLSVEEQKRGQERYERQKRERMALNEKRRPSVELSYYPHPDLERGTVLASQSTLANIVLPSDCTNNYVMGGTLMKMMDNTVVICAIRHCRAYVLTACIDAINFLEPVRNGEVMFFTAWPTFTSNRSIEVEVTCEAEGRHGRSQRIASAYFTCVVIEDQAVPIVPLKLQTEDERRRFEEGKKRYIARKGEKHT